MNPFATVSKPLGQKSPKSPLTERKEQLDSASLPCTPLHRPPQTCPTAVPPAKNERFPFNIRDTVDWIIGDRYMASKKSLEINPDHLIMKDLCERVKIGEIPCDLDVLIFETDSALFRRRARHLLQQNSRMIKHGLGLDEADAVSPHPPQWRLI